MREEPFQDRAGGGEVLAAALAEAGVGADAVVVGLARGGVETAAVVAARLGLPLDAVAVRKIGHPWQPEYALGAVAPAPGGVFLREADGVVEETLRRLVHDTGDRAHELDTALHAGTPARPVAGCPVVLVDDGLATGATMIAAVRWARRRGAASVTVAVPVASTAGLADVRHEADRVVCPRPRSDFRSVGSWYRRFNQVSEARVRQLLVEAARRVGAENY